MNLWQAIDLWWGVELVVRYVHCLVVMYIVASLFILSEGGRDPLFHYWTSLLPPAPFE